MFNPQGLRGGFDFTMTIPMEAELEEPFFFYCGQGDHCAKRGMVIPSPDFELGLGRGFG